MFLLQTLNQASCFQPCSHSCLHGFHVFPTLSLSKILPQNWLACFLIPSRCLLSPADKQLSTVPSLISMLLSSVGFPASKIEFFSLTISPFSCSHRFMHFKFLYCEVLHRSGDECMCSIYGFLSQYILFIYSLTFYLLENNMTPVPCLQLALDP